MRFTRHCGRVYAVLRKKCQPLGQYCLGLRFRYNTLSQIGYTTLFGYLKNENSELRYYCQRLYRIQY